MRFIWVLFLSPCGFFPGDVIQEQVSHCWKAGGRGHDRHPKLIKALVIKYSITQLFYTSRDGRCCSLKLERVSFLLWWGSGKQSLGRRKYANCLNQFKWDDLRWSIRNFFLDPKTLVFGVIRTWATWISLQPRCYVLRSWEMPFRCRDKSQRLEPRRSWMDLAHFCKKVSTRISTSALVYIRNVVWIFYKRNRASEWPFEEITWSIVNNVKHDNHIDRNPPIQRRLPTSSSETKHLYNA